MPSNLGTGWLAVQVVAAILFLAAVKRAIARRRTPSLSSTNAALWEHRSLVALAATVVFGSFFFWSSLWGWSAWLVALLKYAAIGSLAVAMACAGLQGWYEGD